MTPFIFRVLCPASGTKRSVSVSGFEPIPQRVFKPNRQKHDALEPQNAIVYMITGRKERSQSFH